MRIALAGSGGTGKTVTSLEIARLMRYPRIESQARHVFEELKAESMENNPAQTPEQFLKVQAAILERQIAHEQEVTLKSPEWVSERTVLDTAGYCAFWAAAMPLVPNSKWAKQHELIKDKALGIVNRALQHSVSGPYDRVFIMPYGRVRLSADLHRSGDAMYQRAIDLMIKGLVFTKLSAVTSLVPPLSGENETDTALWIIRACGLEPRIPKSEWHKGIPAAHAEQSKKALE